MELSISRIANLTGKDRHTVAIRMSGLCFKDGTKGAKLYESAEALAAVYSAGNLEDARAKQALSQAALNTVREQILRKTRIPIEIVTQVMDEIFQSMAATLKAANGKTLSPELINELFAEFRSIPAKLKW
jgi:hypothetical protein